MINRDTENLGKITVTCDRCPDEFETDTDSFGEAIGAMKSAGWSVRNVGGEWEHRCPDCN